MSLKSAEEYLKPNGRKTIAHFMELIQAAIFYYEGHGHFRNGNIYWCYALNGVIGLILGWTYFQLAYRLGKKYPIQFAGTIFNSTDIKSNFAGVLEIVALFAWIPLGFYFDSYGVLIPYIAFNYSIYFWKRKFADRVQKENNWEIRKESNGFSIICNGSVLCSIGDRNEIRAVA